MSACEKCWRDAIARALLLGGSVSGHYSALLEDRRDEPCPMHGDELRPSSEVGERDRIEAVDTARRYVRLPSIDSDSRRVLSALLAAYDSTQKREVGDVMPNERFMRHHYGASGYVDPATAIVLPDSVSAKMLQNEVAVLERRLAQSASKLETAREALQQHIEWLREEDRMSRLESERYANEGNQVQAQRAIGLAAGRREAADMLEPALAALSSPEAPQESVLPDFVRHLARQREFSERTFGPGRRTAGVVDHIRKELHEIEAKPDDLSEWMDVAILALDGAWRAGYSPEQIASALVAKQTKNESRQWPDWRMAAPGKAIEHVRAECPTCGADLAGSFPTCSGCQLVSALKGEAP